MLAPVNCYFSLSGVLREAQSEANNEAEDNGRITGPVGKRSNAAMNFFRGEGG